MVVAVIIFFLYKFFLKQYSISLGEKRIQHANRITSRVKQVIDGSVDLFTLKAGSFSKKYISDAFDGYGFIIGQVNNLRRSPVKIIELSIILLFVIVLLSDMESFMQKDAQLLGTLGVFFVGLLRMGSALAIVYGLILSVYNKMPSLRKVFNTALKENNTQTHTSKSANKIEKIKIHKCKVSRSGTGYLSIENQECGKGNLYALVGESGIGKTTLCYALCGLLEPDDFLVEVGGMKFTNPDDLRNEIKIIYVPQTPVFFETTIQENIEIGKDGKGLKCGDLLKRVNLHHWVEKMPDKYNETIGDRGILPSGGQMKRLALARALGASPQVLVVDEPSSGLDSNTENVILELLLALSREMIVIVVTHSEQIIERSLRLNFLLEKSS